MPFRWFNHVYVRLSKYEKVGVLPMRIVKSNVSSVGPSSERNRGGESRFVFFRKYTNLFILRFVSLLCLRSTLRLYTIMQSVANVFVFRSRFCCADLAPYRTRQKLFPCCENVRLVSHLKTNTFYSTVRLIPCLENSQN